MITEAATTRQSESDIEISHVVRWSDGEPHNQKLTAEMMGEATTSVSLTAQGKMFVDRYGPNAAWINLSFEQTRELGKWLLSSTRPSVLQRAKDWIASRRRPALVTDEELK